VVALQLLDEKEWVGASSKVIDREDVLQDEDEETQTNEEGRLQT